LERKFDKTNFISPKRIPQNNPGLLGLRKFVKKCGELCSMIGRKKIGIHCTTTLQLDPGVQHVL
jgi:hypothetical protein